MFFNKYILCFEKFDSLIFEKKSNEVRLKQKIMNWNGLVLKSTESLLVFCKYAIYTAAFIMTLALIFRPDSFTEFTISMDASYFAETDIILPKKPQRLNVQDGIGLKRWVSDGELYVDRVHLLIRNGRNLRVLSYFFLLIALSIIYSIIHQLLGLVRSIIKEKPFIRENVKRIRFIGLLLIGVEVFLLIIDKIIFWLSKGLIVLEDLSYRSSISLGTDLLNNWIFVGVMILIIAQVFKSGIELKEEQELTI